MTWGNLRGLSWRQRAFFQAMRADYLDAFTVVVYLPSVAVALWGYPPMDNRGWGYLLCFVPMVVATELWLLAVNRPFFDRRSKQRNPYGQLWRHRVMRAGMAPVFQRASLKAILGGRKHKPVYVVTRKEHDLRWHWRYTLAQSTGVLAVAIIAVLALAQRRLPDPAQLVVTLYWGGLNMVLLSAFISRGWHGLSRAGRALLAPASPVLEDEAAPLTSG